MKITIVFTLRISPNSVISFVLFCFFIFACLFCFVLAFVHEALVTFIGD